MPNPKEMDELDASWDEPEPSLPEPSPTPDLDDLDEGWDSPRRHKTGVERAQSRKEKAAARAQRQRDRALEAARKQKQKQRKPRPERSDSTEPEAPRRPNETQAAATARVLSASQAKRSWVRMFVAVGIIVVVAAFVLFVIVR